MAFASVGSLGTIATKSSGTTSVITTTAAAEVGNVVLVLTAWDNTATADGDSTNLSCADSAGNTYTKLKEYTVTDGAAADGLTLAVFVSIVTSELASAGTITVTSDTARVAKASTAWEFTKGAGTTVEVEGTIGLEVNEVGADPASLTVSGLPSREYLFVNAFGRESTGTFTKAAADTAITQASTTGGGAATNVHVAGGFQIATATSKTVDPASSSDTNAHIQFLIPIYEVSGGTPITVTLVNATETNTPQALSLDTLVTLAPTTEADVAQALSLDTLVTLIGATESDVAQALTRLKRATLTPATEASAAQPLTLRTLVTLGFAAETDVAVAITVDAGGGVPITVTLVPATETDVAQALALRKVVTLTSPTETDVAVALSHLKRVTFTPATETDAAQLLSLFKNLTLGFATESDVVQAASVFKAITLTPAAETALAEALSLQKIVTLGRASEFDIPVAITIQGQEVTVVYRFRGPVVIGRF